MKHSISQSTIEFLKSLEGKVEEEMVDYIVYKKMNLTGLFINRIFDSKSFYG